MEPTDLPRTENSQGSFACPDSALVSLAAPPSLETARIPLPLDR